ncbi:MAG: hypothetical protein HY747_10260, partial [Elusimicrobia bacterium]|nr:hypothetical protein [Elusimicrobiota bacterium]
MKIECREKAKKPKSFSLVSSQHSIFNILHSPQKFISLLIVTSLIITTPGLDCYRALAAVITTTDGKAVDCSQESHPSCPPAGQDTGTRGHGDTGTEGQGGSSF